MNDPFRVGLLATSYEVERCVDYNTVILYSQAWVFENPVAPKITRIFFSNIWELKADFGGPNLFFSSWLVPDNPRGLV